MFRSFLHVSDTHVAGTCKVIAYNNYFSSVHFVVNVITSHTQLNERNNHHVRLMNFPRLLRFLILLPLPYGSVLVLPSVFVTIRR